MPTDQITRCPNCLTAFQITAGQIATAAGSVRCGSCLQVFDAVAGMVSAETLAQDTGISNPVALATADPDRQQLKDPSDGPELLSRIVETPPSVEEDGQQDVHDSAPHPGPSTLRKPLPESIGRGPIHLETRDPSRIPKLLAWTGVNLMLAIALFAQLAYLFFDAWRIHPKLAPWIERGCTHFSCPPPGRNVLDQLETRKLRISSHAEQSGVLVLKLELVNRAAFSQPLPDLEIDFIDVIGSTIETRRIPPQTYVPGFDPQTDFLAARSAQELYLETPDPGESAVNYTLRLRHGGQR